MSAEAVSEAGRGGQAAGAPAATVIAGILQGYYRQMVHNEAGALAGVDAEALHDFRVALRRSRTMVKHFGDLFAPAAMTRLRRDLAWLAKATGHCRDWDVFAEQIAVHLEQMSASPPLATTLVKVIAGRRRLARRQFKRALEAGRYQQLKGAWAALTPARASTDGGPADLTAVAGRRLRDHARQVFHEARHIKPKSSMDRLHTLRKDCKEMRYMLDAFQPILSGEAAQHQRKELRNMQDLLGALCDVDVQRGLLQQCRDIWPARADPAGPIWIAKLDRLLRKQRTAMKADCAKGARHFARKKNRQWYEQLGESSHAGTGGV